MQDGISGNGQATNRIDEARRAHERGWVLTPLIGKKPMRKGWSTEAPPSIEQVLEWARAGSVGLRTGKLSGVTVIDDDTAEQIAASALTLPDTVTAITGAGNNHYYFRTPTKPVKNSVGRLLEGVDVRGDGGQVVFVGSVHPETGQPYRWASGKGPDDIPLAELPEELLQKLRGRVKQGQRPRGVSAADLRELGLERLREAAAELQAATEGSRNDLLNAKAFGMGRLVSAEVLDRGEVEVALRDAAILAGLGRGEIEATLRSGMDGAERDPADLDRLRACIQHRRRAGEQRDRSSDGTRPEIRIEGGALPGVVDQAEEALLGSPRPSIYQRGGVLVRAIRLKQASRQAAVLGPLSIRIVEPHFLMQEFTRHGRFLQWDGMAKDFREVDCPERIAKTYMARDGAWEIPVLRGAIEAPTLREDGSILEAPGHDLKTGLLYDPGRAKFPNVPSKPTQDDAVRALDELRRIYAEFPFVAGCDASTAISATLTGLIRHSLRTAPLHAFRAPTSASGKSLLADIPSLICTGRPTPAMSMGSTEEETGKQILSALLEGSPFQCFDNLEQPLCGESLCSVLTQETYNGRILGKSRMVTVPTATTWFATGNNMVVKGDMASRVVLCDLDANCERPAEREFELNLHEFIPKHRVRLVIVGLTVLRAYEVAGRPCQGLNPFGRFEEWSDRVRGALVWCGMPDPCEGVRRMGTQDPVRAGLRSVLESWHKEFESRPTSAATAIRNSKQESDPLPSVLRDSLQMVCGKEDGGLCSRRLGRYLAKFERRVEGGLRFERAGDRQGSGLWRVVRSA